MSGLSAKSCVPCQSGVAPLQGRELAARHKQLGKTWKVVSEHHLEKEFKFEDFREALAFVNKVGDLAEEQGHHPDLYVSWGKVRVMLCTHKVDGLTDNDFILAAKIQKLV